MIVELAGLPGSGKTWQRNRLLSVLAAADQPAQVARRLRDLASGAGPPAPESAHHVTRSPSLWLGSWLRYPRVLVAALPAVARSPRSWSQKTFALRLLGLTLDDYRFLEENGDGDRVVLFDEGLVQRAFTMFVDRDGAPRATDVDRYLEAMPRPDVVIFLAADPQRCLARLQARPAGLPRRFQQIEATAVEEILVAGAAMFSHLIDGLQANGGEAPQVFLIDANDHDATSREIDERVLPLLTSTSRGRGPAEVWRADDPPDLDLVLGRLQVAFAWSERATGFRMVNTWKGKGVATFHRCRREGTGQPDVVVKQDPRWSAETPALLFREIEDFARTLADEGVPDIKVPRPLGWLEAPRILCVQYVPGVDLSTVLRFPHHQRWSAGDVRLLSVLETCGRALGTYHRCNRPPSALGEEVAEAHDDLQRIARRLGLSRCLASIDRQQIVVRRSYDDFGPQNLRLAEQGALYVMDPPAHRFYRPVHKDIGKFRLELRRALQAGGRGELPVGPRPSADEAWEAFCRGYAATGPVDVRRSGDLWLVHVYEEYRAATKVVTRLRAGNYREASQYALSAGSQWPRLRLGPAVARALIS